MSEVVKKPACRQSYSSEQRRAEIIETVSAYIRTENKEILTLLVPVFRDMARVYVGLRQRNNPLQTKRDLITVLGDHLQEVITQYDEKGGNFFGWAYRVMKNKAMNFITYEKIRRNQSAFARAQEKPAERMSALDMMCEEETRNEIAAALYRLPEQERDFLAYNYGLLGEKPMTLKEIADQTKVPIGTIKSQMYTARKKLATLLRHLAPERNLIPKKGVATPSAEKPNNTAVCPEEKLSVFEQTLQELQYST